jgi:phosphatidylinositol 3-kinase
LTLKISSFQGKRPKLPSSTLTEAQRLAGSQLPGLSDLFVVCQLWSDSCPLTPPFRTAHKTFASTYTWNEALTLPIKYRELPLNAQLTFTVYDSRGPPAATSAVPVGGTTLKLFGKKCTLKKGRQRLYLWKDKPADGAAQTTTPSKLQTEEADELGRLEKVRFSTSSLNRADYASKLVKKHQSGDIPRVDWLDKLAFRKIEQIHAVRLEHLSSKMPIVHRLRRPNHHIITSTSTYLASTFL